VNRGTRRKQSKKLLLPQGRLPNQGILSLSCQPSSCGAEKLKPKAAKAGVRCETMCSSSWGTEAPTFRGRMNQKKSLPSSSAPEECKQTHLSVEHYNRILEM